MVPGLDEWKGIYESCRMEEVKIEFIVGRTKSEALTPADQNE